MRLLLVEDNQDLAESLVTGLREEELEVDHAATAASAIARAMQRDLDLMILDLGLPDGDGLDVLAELRNAQIYLPVLVLTARDAIESRVSALDAGADDYLVKPFAFAELVARIQALSRRASGPRWVRSTSGPLKLRDDLTVEAAGKVVQLSPREFSLLGCLLQHVGEVVTRSALLEQVFGYTFDPKTNVIDVHLAHLRRKLTGFPIQIDTVRGAGIRLLVTR